MEDLVCITETWCSENVSAAAVQMPGYGLVRRDTQTVRSSWSTNWSTEILLSWPPSTQTANGSPRVAAQMACQTSPE